MKQSNYFSLKFVRNDSPGENDKLVFLDQTKLPLEEKYIETEKYERVAEAIEKLEQLLSIPSLVTITSLKFNKFYDPLREHPRFIKLIAN